MNRILGFLICCVCFAQHSYAAEPFSCGDPVYGMNLASLQELVEASHFIGLYLPVKAEITENKFSLHFGDNVYKYRMFSSRSLKGDAPTFVDMLGTMPYETIPAQYLAATYRHSLMGPENPGKWGRTFVIPLEDEETCIFAPRFQIRYTYLILGGVNSSVSYEVILDEQVDHWLNLVEAEIARQKAGDK